MTRKIQSALLLLLFALVSANGQSVLLRCLCSGKVVAAADAEQCLGCRSSSPAGHCPRDMGPGPCDGGDCFVVLAEDPQNLPEWAVAVPGVLVAAPAPRHPRLEPKAAFASRVTPLRPCRQPDQEGPPLTILFASFLI